jgi:hypothetical protein
MDLLPEAIVTHGILPFLTFRELLTLYYTHRNFIEHCKNEIYKRVSQLVLPHLPRELLEWSVLSGSFLLHVLLDESQKTEFSHRFPPKAIDVFCEGGVEADYSCDILLRNHWENVRYVPPNARPVPEWCKRIIWFKHTKRADTDCFKEEFSSSETSDEEENDDEEENEDEDDDEEEDGESDTEETGVQYLKLHILRTSPYSVIQAAPLNCCRLWFDDTYLYLPDASRVLGMCEKARTLRVHPEILSTYFCHNSEMEDEPSNAIQNTGQLILKYLHRGYVLGI